MAVKNCKGCKNPEPAPSPENITVEPGQTLTVGPSGVMLDGVSVPTSNPYSGASGEATVADFLTGPLMITQLGDQVVFRVGDTTVLTVGA